MTKIDDTWEQLFAKYDILRRIAKDGAFEISAKQIKKFQEPRLATKFDHESNLPSIFRKHSITILPNSRGTYVLGTFAAYADLQTPFTKPKLLPILNFETLNPNTISSETLALNYAHASGALYDFTGENDLVPTVSGRMGSGHFDFNIRGKNKQHKISVKSSQIEIDAGYEGKRSLVLVEAKNHIEETFLVRQLYYPFRTWNTRVQKPVRNLYVTWTNGVLVLREYGFNDPNDYSSLQLVKSTRYMVATGITKQELYSIVSSVQPNNSIPNNIPYPQADSFERVINLIELCLNHDVDSEEIRTNYDFTKRQVDYYTNAAIFIEMIEKKGKGIYAITGEGRSLLKLSYRERQIRLVQAIAKDKTMRACILESIKTNRIPEINYITNQLITNSVPIKGATLTRRAQTVRSWVEWVFNLAN